MKMRTTIFIVFVLIGILPYAGAAHPGIQVTTNPMSITTAGSTTINYTITITELDGIDKTISSLGITQPPGWTYTFNPDLTGANLPASGSITTNLSVIIPSAQTSQIYTQQVTVEAQYWGFATDTGYADFTTQITGNTPTAIPEFPTIALPTISALGIMLLISRWKGRSL